MWGSLRNLMKANVVSILKGAKQASVTVGERDCSAM